MTAYLGPSELNDALTIRDLSNPDGRPHAMQTLLNGVIDALRSHTSASIPPLLRALATDESIDELWAIPGLVNRRDSIDRTHVGTPHQVDLGRVTSREKLGSGDLQGMIGSLVETVVPGAQWRAVPAVHPYTREGLQIDVLTEANGSNLRNAGSWPRICSPTPDWILRGGRDWLGMGLDRALMLRKGIPDIRLLRSTDERMGLLHNRCHLSVQQTRAMPGSSSV